MLIVSIKGGRDNVPTVLCLARLRHRYGNTLLAALVRSSRSEPGQSGPRGGQAAAPSLSLRLRQESISLISFEFL